MKILEVLNEIPKLFSWYFLLRPSSRLQFNYMLLIALLITISYYNDKQHRENYRVLSVRNDTINNSRTREQEKYTAKLEFYTDKFNHLLEILIQQKQEREEIKKEL